MVLKISDAARPHHSVEVPRLRREPAGDGPLAHLTTVADLGEQACSVRTLPVRTPSPPTPHMVIRASAPPIAAVIAHHPASPAGAPLHSGYRALTSVCGRQQSADRRSSLVARLTIAATAAHELLTTALGGLTP